jgi:hypothetical protein
MFKDQCENLFIKKYEISTLILLKIDYKLINLKITHKL